MQNKALSMGQLSLLNLKRRPFRTGALFFVVALLSLVLFGGTILSVSLKNGLDSMKARFGADLIVVPLEYDKGMESILLKGEPAYFYFDHSIAEQILQIEGVSQATAQFYLTSLSSDCCSTGAAQIIGFDPDADFVVQPWISEAIGGNIANGTVIVGNDIQLGNDNTLKLYDHNYPVAARLDKTGTGLDQSIYANLSTVKELFAGAKAKGVYFPEDTNPSTSFSSVLIKVGDGYTSNVVSSNISQQIDGIQIIQTQNMISSTAESIGKFSSFLYIFAVVFVVLAFVILAILFSVTTNERKKEFSVLRTLGATRKYLTSVILTESFFISMVGGIAGIAVASLIVFPFSVYIGDKVGMPYIQPSLHVVAVILLSSLFISFVVAPLSSAFSAIKISRAETYLTMREGE